MAKLPTGIAIVTIADNMGKMGMTISTFNSLSLDPMLVMFTLNLQAKRYKRIISSEYFVINVLSEDQGAISQLFALNQHVNWNETEDSSCVGQGGCPVLKNITAYFECKLHKILEGGDHAIIVGEVISGRSYDAKPLIYHEREYTKIHNKF